VVVIQASRFHGFVVRALADLTPGCLMTRLCPSTQGLKSSPLPGVRDVEVAVTFDPPWTPERMTPDARMLLNP
jgi:metal-sulfur cluster biosynthetic enzyme